MRKAFALAFAMIVIPICLYAGAFGLMMLASRQDGTFPLVGGSIALVSILLVVWSISMILRAFRSEAPPT